MTEPVTQQQETVTKQKNPLRVEQGRKLVGYNWHKKAELKHLNDQITKQDGIQHKPRSDTNNYVHVRSLYRKFKKPEQTLIDVPPPPVVKTSTEPKRDIFEML